MTDAELDAILALRARIEMLEAAAIPPKSTQTN